MPSRVQKWGNSLALRIPKAYAEEVGLRENCEVTLSTQDGALVVQPARRVRYELASLLDGVTDRNRHPEVDTGRPEEGEAW
jgi:antitoxin MazE